MPLITNTFTDDDALDSGNPTLISQALRLAERRKDLIEQARAVAQKGEPQGQMISGRYVAPAKSQFLSAVIQPAAIQFQQRALDNQASALEKQSATAAAQHLAGAPAPGASQQEKLAWAQRGAQIPGLDKIMTAYLQDQTINEPDRIAARKDAKELKQQQIAEAQRKQDADLAQKREAAQQRSDDMRWQTEQNNNLRRDLHSAIGSVTGGDKASNYQVFQDKDGNLTRVNKLTGESTPLGAGGREAASITAGNQKAAAQQGASQDALSDIAEARKLLPNATGSGVGAAIDTLYRGVGQTNQGMLSNRQLKTISGRLTMSVPRFEGPQSDRDVQTYKEQAADVGNENLTTAERMAALKQVEVAHQRTLKNAPRAAAAVTGKGPTIREAVESAVQQHTSGPKELTYNPATGKLE